jgi:hypothetical protein
LVTYTPTESSELFLPSNLNIRKPIFKDCLPVHLVVNQELHSLSLKASLASLELIELRLRIGVEVEWASHIVSLSLIPSESTNANLKCEVLGCQKSVLVIDVLLIVKLIPLVMSTEVEAAELCVDCHELTFTHLLFEKGEGKIRLCNFHD